MHLPGVGVSGSWWRGGGSLLAELEPQEMGESVISEGVSSGAGASVHAVVPNLPQAAPL